MNLRLLSKLLGILSLLLGIFMLFSLPWALPGIGEHTHVWQGGADLIGQDPFEYRGVRGLVFSTLICAAVGGLLLWIGRKSEGRMFRKEAMAIVGLSWILATLLGAMPFYLSEVKRGPAVRIFEPGQAPMLARPGWRLFRPWREVDVLQDDEFRVVQALVNAESNARGLSRSELVRVTGLENADDVFERLKQRQDWNSVLRGPGEEERFSQIDRASHYRVHWVDMTLCDCLFESQSGFSTTGATVISDLEDPVIVPHCILFWRSSTHFLGGLGIIVLFVVILGQGSAGKVLMRAEMPGPTKEGATARMQHTAWLFASVYVVLNVVLAVIFCLFGMSLFDALCHAFGTMATGGFSTYNQSLGHFDSPVIESITTLFMVLAGTNFTLLILVLLGRSRDLWGDIEWRTYMIIILAVTGLVVLIGMRHGDKDFDSIFSALRYGSFQVVSIITTTGYGTSDFDQWNQFGRAVLLALMFVGGCAGSTGGGMKVIRHVMFAKILRIEIERAFHPRVIRLLRVGGKVVEDQDLRRNVLVYFAIIGVLFVGSWLFVVTVEPDSTWGPAVENKLLDSASVVSATLNNIGPGLGIVGSAENYSLFSGGAKILFVWLMMLGRLEIFSILVLFVPSFWRDQ